MSYYRCLFCGGKFEEYDDDEYIYTYEPSQKDIKKSAKEDECSYEEQLKCIEESDYHWIVCKDCHKEREND